MDNALPGDALRGPVTTKDWIRSSIFLFVMLVFCTLATWYELGRAEGGNSLSWAYVFEWPLLGIFGIYMWWKFLHPETIGKSKKKPGKELSPEFDSMRQAWQESQVELAKSRQIEPGTHSETP